MIQVLVVYASDYGNTQKAAEEVAAGARSVQNTRVFLKRAEEVTEKDFSSSDGVVIGTPVHMGSCDWRIKKLIDTVCSELWMKGTMIGKVAGVFVTGSGFGNSGGGAELAMLSLLTNFAQLGMIIVPLPKSTPGYARGGLQWGPCARSAGENMEQNGVSTESLEAARCHGAYIARTAHVLAGGRIFGTGCA